MDILNVDIVEIEGRCYRKLPTRIVKVKEDFEDDEETMYFSKPSIINDEDLYSDLNIERGENKFFYRTKIPSCLVGYIVGAQFKNKANIERQFHVQINVTDVPRQRESDIVIKGNTLSDVGRASRKVVTKVMEKRWNREYTHFISIAMNNTGIKRGFQEFKDSILKNDQSRGIYERLFEPSSKLHLTITMLLLLSDREIKEAGYELTKIKEDIQRLLGSKPLEIEVKGVEYMNDDPAEVSVLYGKVQETDSDNRLQIIADMLQKRFAEMNFTKMYSENVKLHMTLMKTESDEKGNRTTFDARNILKTYEHFVFGTVMVNNIFISIRYTGDKNSYYSHSCSIKL